MFKITDVDVENNVVSVLDTSDGVVEGIPAFDLLSILAGGQFTFEGATFVKDTTSVAIEFNGNNYTVKLSSDSANTAYIEKEAEEGVSEDEEEASIVFMEGVILDVEGTAEESSAVDNSDAESEEVPVAAEEEKVTVTSAESASVLESTYISAVEGESVSAEDIARSVECTAGISSKKESSEGVEDATEALMAIYSKFEGESSGVSDEASDKATPVDSDNSDNSSAPSIDIQHPLMDSSSSSIQEVSADEHSQIHHTESTVCETECAKDTLSSLANRYNLGTSEEDAEVYEEKELEEESRGTPIESDAGTPEQEVESTEKDIKQSTESAKGDSTAVKKNSLSKIGKSQSKKFKVDGKQYVCLLKIAGVSDFENAFFAFEKTCSDFVYFCGTGVKLFLPDICVSNIPIKDKTLQCIDKMLKGRVKNSEGTDISLFDVCTGKDKSVQIYRPFSDELSSASADAECAVLRVSVLEA